MTRRMLALFVLLAVCAGATALCSIKSTAPTPAMEKTVDELIRELGSDDFATREAATETLLKRDDAEVQVKAAIRSPNPEVARRAADIYDRYVVKQIPLQIKRMEKIAKFGYYDLLTECCAMWGMKKGGEGAWPVLEGAMSPLVFNKDEKPHFGPLKEPKLLIVDANTKASPSSHSRAVIRHPVNLFSVDNSIVIVDCEGFTVNGVGRSLLCSNRDLALKHKVTKNNRTIHSVIVCDGNVTLDRIEDTLVLCSGSCTFTENQSLPESCIVISNRDRVVIPDAPERAGDRGALATRLKEEKHFFEIRAVGLHATINREEIVVTKVEQDSPFKTAGLRLGDRILRVDGTPVRNEQELRQQVRRCTAAGLGDVKVSRGGKEQSVTVNLMAWPP